MNRFYSQSEGYGRAGRAESAAASNPGSCQAEESERRDSEAVGAVFEVALIEVVGVELLPAAEAGAMEFLGHLLRREKELQRLPGGGNAAGQTVEGGLAFFVEHLPGHGVVQSHTRAGGHGGNSSQRRPKGLRSQIGNDAEPAKEGGLAGMQAGQGEALSKRAVLEIEGDEAQGGGFREPGTTDELALPLLGCRQIRFKDGEMRKGIVEGEGIEPGTEDHVLSGSGGDGLCQMLFRNPAAHGHRTPKVACHQVFSPLHVAGIVVADQLQNHGIDQHGRLIHRLVGRTSDCNAKGRPTCLRLLHLFHCRDICPWTPRLVLCLHFLNHAKDLRFIRQDTSIAEEARYDKRMNWILWALLSAGFAAATALLAKVGVARVDSNLALALRTTVVLVFAWAMALVLARSSNGLLGELRGLDRRTVLFLVLSGLATGLSWICYFRALQLGPASRVAPIDKLSVPLVLLLAWLLLGEKITPGTLVGGLLITAGAVVIALG